MHKNMLLDEGIRLGHYEIISLLGKGGMGEVYLAADTKLRRQVAVKVISGKTSNRERVQRFKQEALAASALNHPNILTVHNFGQTGDLYYLVTEHIKGITLRQRLAEKITTGEALNIAIQVGKAVSEAHAAEIVHRDIKPENIMLLPDGLVKVLDFGLAKLSRTEEPGPSDIDQSTVSVFETQPGLLIGTISYMSPEQLCQKKTDQQTDIWSLGIILFEMLTGSRPFAGSSMSEIIASVLKQPLPSFVKFGAESDPALERAIALMLAKEKDRRYQKMSEAVADLIEISRNPGCEPLLSATDPNDGSADKKIRDAFLTDENQPGVETQSTAGQPFKDPDRWPKRLLVLLVILMIAGAGWFYLVGGTGQKVFPPAPDFKSRPVTSAGNIVKAALSADGKIVAYVMETTEGQQSLRIGQLDLLPSGSRELAPPGNVKYAGLTFSPDGTYLYYYVFGTAEDTGNNENTTGILYRIPYLGDTQSAREILRDIDSPVTFSPDGKQFAYIQTNWREQKDYLIAANADGGGKNILLERKYPDFISAGEARESPVWSPDGQSIVCPVGSKAQNDDFMSLVKINLADRTETPVTNQKWKRVGRLVWLKNADQLLLTVAEKGSDLYQIIRLAVKNGETQALTKDFLDYTELTVSADNKRMIAVESEKKSSLWIAQAGKLGLPARLTGSRYDAMWGGTWMPDGKLIYSSFENGARDLWQVGVDDNSRRQLTFDPDPNDYPSVTPNGKYIVFASARGTDELVSTVSHLWRISLSGTDLTQLTNAEGEYFPQLTPDGKWVVYVAGTGKKTLWKIPVEGGAPVRITTDLANWESVSPDGRTVACLTMKPADEQFRLGVYSIETGRLLEEFPVPKGIGTPNLPPVIRWMPDGKSILYVVSGGNVSNLREQPLDGGAARNLTDFTSDVIFWCDWSKDGRRLAMARGSINNNMILFSDF